MTLYKSKQLIEIYFCIKEYLFIFAPSFKRSINVGSLAQLVQSTWFTPRGSGVRTPQLPHKKQSEKQSESGVSRSVFFFALALFLALIT